MTVLVGRQAPDFNAAAVLANGEINHCYHLMNEIKGKYAAIFFYPLDFTFVCPSELIAIDHAIEEFDRCNTKVLAISIDSQFTHNAWRNTPIHQGGIGPVRYDLIADIQHSICRNYGVEHPELGVAFRATFIIDPKGIVRAQIVNDLPLGRNIRETIRTIDALHHHEQYGEVCPANWNKGDTAMQASIQGVSEYLTAHADEL